MLRVRLLGELTLEIDGQTIDPPASRRARSLLAWLAVERGMHLRSTLAGRFWPDVLDESARTSLRTALSALRRSLGPASERYLIANRESVGLADQELVWTDVGELERRMQAGQLEAALELCRGELLAGLDDDWVYERRDAHEERIASVLGRLAARAESEHDPEGAIGFTRRQVALDPLAEEPQRDLIRRLALAGDRAAAIKAYERFSKRLRDELRILPSRATRELVEALRQRSDAGEHGAETALESVPHAAPALAATSEPAGAIVTLLFTDLVGSTELLGRLGDDEAERLRRLHFRLLRDVANARGGEEVKNVGDGLMVAFSSAVDAVCCAIEIQRVVHRHNARLGEDRLRVRVGLNVGEPIRDEGDYFGTSVVVAKRLCDSAEGGQILASELLGAVVGSRGKFDFRPCGSLRLKGITEPVGAVQIGWEPAAERRIPLPPPLVIDESTELVGRASQLEQLTDHWQVALDGRQRIAMLVGEPGIGKTRLAAELCRTAYADGGTVLLGRCYEDSPAPYQPFVEALSYYVAQSPVDDLRVQSGRHRVALARLVPELGEQPPPGAGSSVPEPEREQFLMFDAVASLLREAADAHPLVLALDDLHWADSPTLLLLRHIARSCEHTALLILGTYRETEVDDVHPLTPALAELRRARALHSLAIGGLGESDVAALISARTGRESPAAVARSILERTEGNPYFVEEVLREVEVDDDWNAALARMGVPESVKDLLLRRLRRLDECCKRLLAAAAVIGHDFTLDVLARVEEVPARRAAEDLEHAIEAKVVEESPGQPGRYRFAHALIRETIYERLSGARRAQLHRVIGESIEDLLADARDEHASTLALHFSAAGDVAKAYRYHCAAAAAADRVYASEPALRHYTAALEAGGRLGLDAIDEPTIRQLLVQRGRLRFHLGADAAADSDLQAALEAARRCSDRLTQMEALNELGIMRLRSDLADAAACHEAALEIAEELHDTVAQTLALDRLAVISSHLLELDRAVGLGERALELAKEADDPVVTGRAMDSIKLAALQLGDLRRLAELTDELVPLWRELSDLWYLQWTLLEAAFVPIGSARWDDAAGQLAEALSTNRRIRDPVAEPLILDALCWLHRSRGAYDEATAAGRRAVALAVRAGWEALPAPTLGCALLEAGDAAGAVSVLEQGLAAAEKNGDRQSLTRCLGHLAWGRWLLGAHDEARSLADRGERELSRVTAPPGGAFVYGAQAYAAIARVHVAAGVPERGEALLRPLLEAVERSGWLEAVATIELVLGLCLEARGERDQAVTLLARAAELSDAHGIPAPAREAYAALSRINRAGSSHTTS